MIRNPFLAVVEGLGIIGLAIMLLAAMYNTLRAAQRKKDGTYDAERCKADRVKLDMVPIEKLSVGALGLPMALVVVMIYVISQIAWVSYNTTYLPLGILVAATMWLRTVWGLVVTTKIRRILNEQLRQSEPGANLPVPWTARQRIDQYYCKVFEVQFNNIGYMRVVDVFLAFALPTAVALCHVLFWPITLVAAVAHHTWGVRNPGDYSKPDNLSSH